MSSTREQPGMKIKPTLLILFSLAAMSPQASAAQSVSPEGCKLAVMPAHPLRRVALPDGVGFPGSTEHPAVSYVTAEEILPELLQKGWHPLESLSGTWNQKSFEFVQVSGW